jgi:hypothetical protein
VSGFTRVLTRDAVVLDLAQNIALVPLFWLTWLWRRDRMMPDASWFWLAAAFAVSWLADAWAFVLPVELRWVPSLVYPVTQTALVGAVLLRRRGAYELLAMLIVVGVASALLFGATGPDLLLRSLAWGGVVGIVIASPALPPRLRIALSVYFGLGLVVWLLHAAWLIVPTWYVYQGVRLAGLLLFCWAASRPVELRVIRGKITRSHLRARLA